MPCQETKIRIPIVGSAGGKGIGVLGSRLLQPRGLAFTHSLHRDGANHALLYTLERIRKGSPVEILFSPLEGPMRPDFEALGIKVHVIPFTGPSEPFFALLEKDFQFVFCSTMFRADCVCMAAKFGIACVWVIHEKWTERRMDELAALGQLDVGTVRRAFDVCDRVVFVSEGQRGFYGQLFSGKGQCQVIYNGIRSATGSEAERHQERARLGYSIDEYLVLHIGTISVRKGQLASAKAVTKLASSGASRVKLLFVGDLALNDMEKITPAAYIAMIQEHLALHEVPFAFAGAERVGGAATVTMMDVQPQPAVDRLYLACDCVVLPSLNEVLPLVLCEAMAFSRPVIGTRIDFIHEAVTHGENGFLVLPGDEGVGDLAAHMDALSRDPTLSARMGAAGRARVMRQFSLDSMGSQYSQAVLDIVGLRASAPPFFADTVADAAVSAGEPAGAM